MMMDISIHALPAESDHYDNYNLHCTEISIHALLAESDNTQQRHFPKHPQFLSTLSLRRATISIVLSIQPTKFLSTLSLRRATFNACCTQPIHTFLSTLSLRRATKWTPSKCRDKQFLSTLSLRRATILIVLLIQPTRFLSTLSLRRATYMGVTVLGIQHNFYPRSPCGERQGHIKKSPCKALISIHALLAESDSRASRLPPVISISIHALLAESDIISIALLIQLIKFLSTLSLRRATLRPTGGPA